MVTSRTRKLTLESIVCLFVDIAIYNEKLMADIVHQLYIGDQTDKPFTASSALILRRKI
jgi:hypothetical protein